MHNDMTDVMVDLETTSTLPDRGAILQIAAVKFNLETQDCDPNMFNRKLQIPPTRGWSESTRQWWMEQKRGTLDEIMAQAEDPQVVINDFCDWAYPAGSLRFWSRPAHFDYPFISSYCHDYGLINPFHYRYVQDMNSWVRGRFFPKPPPELDIPFTGTSHNALFDALHQLKVLFAYSKEPIG